MAGTKTFKLATEYIELCDLLKATGMIGSGGEAKHAIANGRVKVDGQIELRKKCKIRTGKTILFNGQAIKVA